MFSDTRARKSSSKRAQSVPKVSRVGEGDPFPYPFPQQIQLKIHEPGIRRHGGDKLASFSGRFASLRAGLRSARGQERQHHPPKTKRRPQARGTASVTGPENQAASPLAGNRKPALARVREGSVVRQDEGTWSITETDWPQPTWAQPHEPRTWPASRRRRRRWRCRSPR